MAASETVAPERLAESMAHPAAYDEECPKQSKADFARGGGIGKGKETAAAAPA